MILSVAIVCILWYTGLCIVPKLWLRLTQNRASAVWALLQSVAERRTPTILRRPDLPSPTTWRVIRKTIRRPSQMLDPLLPLLGRTVSRLYHQRYQDKAQALVCPPRQPLQSFQHLALYIRFLVDNDSGDAAQR